MPPTLPALQPVKVALVDTAIDASHPDLAARIVASLRFARGTPQRPDMAHATAVAGLIAAGDHNGVGIDGIAPNAQLLLADVSSKTEPDSFAPDAVARAIRWAADEGARVINLSLGGVGTQPGQQAAIDYAVSRGALVVAAAGNCFGELQRCLPPGAAYSPAWLPHVLAVGATTVDSRPALFSIPSAQWVDLSAPGELITTLWPTRDNPYADTPECAYLGTTACYSTGGADNQVWGATGTSYAAPMVSAAAAILLGVDPHLTPAQLTALLVETARPVASDSLHQTGSGVVDVAAALARVEAGAIPRVDYREPNESAAEAAPVPSKGSVTATLDWRDDPQDTYRLALRRGRRLVVRTRGSVPGSVALLRRGRSAPLATTSIGGTLRATIDRKGVYFMQLRVARARGRYTLAMS